MNSIETPSQSQLEREYSMEMYPRIESQIAFIGGANWDIQIDENGRASAVVKINNSALSSHFGDKQHILKLIKNGYFEAEINGITEYGLECFSGLHNRLIYPENGKRFAILTLPAQPQR